MFLENHLRTVLPQLRARGLRPCHGDRRGLLELLQPGSGPSYLVLGRFVGLLWEHHPWISPDCSLSRVTNPVLAGLSRNPSSPQGQPLHLHSAPPSLVQIPFIAFPRHVLPFWVPSWAPAGCPGEPWTSGMVLVLSHCSQNLRALAGDASCCISSIFFFFLQIWGFLESPEVLADSWEGASAPGVGAGAPPFSSFPQVLAACSSELSWGWCSGATSGCSPGLVLFTPS